MRLFFGLCAVALLAAPLTVRASDSKTLNDHDRIRILLEYNQRLVGMTENYLKDRPRIPADYQGVSDREYIRRYKLEKPLKISPPVEEEATAAPVPKPHLKKK